MIDIAIKLSKLPPGRTNLQYLQSIGWSDFQMLYENAVNKLTHKILNNPSNDKHFLFHNLTNSRSIRSIADNITGPKPQIKPSDKYTLKTFSYNVKNLAGARIYSALIALNYIMLTVYGGLNINTLKQ